MSPIVTALRRQIAEAQAGIEVLQAECPHLKDEVIKTPVRHVSRGGPFGDPDETYWTTRLVCGYCDKWLGEVEGKQ